MPTRSSFLLVRLPPQPRRGTIEQCVLIVAGLILTGCARFHSQPLAPAASYERLATRSLTNEPLRVFLETNLAREFPVWPTNTWDFDMLATAAFFYQPGLEVARAKWEVARGGQITAGQRPNPAITVTPGYDTTTSIPSPWIPLTFLDVPIETAGKRKLRKVQAEQVAEAARLEIANVAWQIRSAVRSALIELVSAQQRLSLLDRQTSLQTNIVGLLEAQVRAGALAASQTAPFRITLLQAKLDRIDAQGLAAQARAQLAEALSIPLSALDGIRLQFEGLESLELIHQLSSAETRRIALVSRPDILASLSEYAASESALRLEIAKQYPDIHLQPGYQYDQGDNKWTLGVVVDLPVLNQNQGPIAEAKARRQQAAANFLALQAKVMAEIDRSVQEVQVAENNLLALRGLAQEQAARVASIDAQLRAGAIEQLDLFTAQSESLTTQIAQLDGRRKLQQAVGALEDAVRRPFQVPESVFIVPRNDHEP